MASNSEELVKVPQGAASCSYLPHIVCDTADILVMGGTIIKVHEGVLIQCPFFANALKPEWIFVRDEKPIDLSDVEADVFAAYVRWLYTHHIEISVGNVRWAKLYVLGERLMHVEYQNAILSAVIEACQTENTYPGEDEVSIVYEGTTVNSTARKLMVDFFYWDGDGDWTSAEACSKFPIEFLRDLVQSLMKERDLPVGQRPWVADKSAYYVGVGKKA